jgi:NADPH2:quinone reductase
MQAMQMMDYGGPEVLQMNEIPDPEIGDNDLLVEVHATAMNPVDYKIRQAPRWNPDPPPFILGFDCSGVVKETGANVTGFSVGDEVYGAPSLGRPGANAELVAVDYRTFAAKPSTLSHAEAAGVPLVTLTAWESLYVHGQMKAGDTVLIHAGAGGVGHIAIQLAKLAGCTVLTTSGREETRRMCSDLGADHVINYREHNVPEVVLSLTDGRGCDIVFDTIGGDTFKEAIGIVAPWGHLVTICPGLPEVDLTPLFFKNGSVHMEFMGLAAMGEIEPEKHGEILTKAGALIDEGKLRCHIGQILPLAALAGAHHMQETGRCIGKTVLTIKDA